MTEPTLDLETTVIRDQPVTRTTGTIQVGTDELDGSTITLGFGGPWGTMYTDLTPDQATALAGALEAAAQEVTSEGDADE
ncbi:hypothetical protein JCM17823_10750 [Halorubrum gandharaense]